MIASTNHLERLDPGIAKRPSRFDRKYFFDDPSREERVQVYPTSPLLTANNAADVY